MKTLLNVKIQPGLDSVVERLAAKAGAEHRAQVLLLVLVKVKVLELVLVSTELRY